MEKPLDAFTNFNPAGNNLEELARPILEVQAAIATTTEKRNEGTMTLTIRTLFAALLCSIFLAAYVQANVPTPKPNTDSVRQALNAKLVPGMLIGNLRIDGNRTNINGISPTNAKVSQFLRNLTESQNFTRVELVSVAQKGGAMHFVIMADVKCPATGSTGDDNLCAKPVSKSGTVFKCSQGGKTVFQDRPCTK